MFSSIHPLGANYFYAAGTSNGYSSARVILLVHLTSAAAGDIEMHVINNEPDGCNHVTDSFVYKGAVFLERAGGQLSSVTGTGTWKSYCFGFVFNLGRWVGAGPCGVSDLHLENNGIVPASGRGNSNKQNKPFISIAPDPVISKTEITYTLATRANVNITVYNAMNQPVKILVNGMQAAGNYSVSWNTLTSAGTAVPNGVYRVVAVTGNEISTASIQVVR